jgi:septal ring factor EnvC (AmiA/AmiB activator)
VIPLCRSKLVIWPLVLCLLLASAICARPCRAEDNYVISGSELRQLSEIFERLETLNQRLSSELSASRENLRKLEDELSGLKQDLAELQSTLARSEQESTQLWEQLQTAQSLLEQAEQSFSEYKSAAESQIKSLRTQRNLAILLAIILALV